MPFRKEFLITAKTGLAGREELLVHLRVIETGHRSAIEPERSGRQDQVRALQAGIPLRGRFNQLGVTLKQLLHAGAVRKQLRQLVVELQVVRDDHGHRRRHGLLDIERRQRRAKALLGFRRSKERESRGRCIRACGRPLQQVVQIAERLIRHWPVLPRGVRPCLTKQGVHRRISYWLTHGGCLSTF